MTWLQPVTLRSGRVTLEPLARLHEAELAEAVKDGELWRLWYTSVPAPEAMGAEIERRLGLQAAGSMLPFAVIDAADHLFDGKVSEVGDALEELLADYQPHTN